MVNAKPVQERLAEKAQAGSEQPAFTDSNQTVITLEPLNPEPELKVEQCKEQLRLVQQQLKLERAKTQRLQTALQETQQEFFTLKTEFNQQLEEKVSQRTLELQLLHNLSQRIGYTLNYEELFRSMLENLHLVVPCDVTGGILLEDRNCNLFLKTNRNLSPSAQAEIQQLLLDSIAKVNGLEVTHELLCLHQLNSDSTEPTQLPIEQIGSYFLVPIIANPDQDKKIVGLLFVGTEREEMLTEDHLRLLYAIANQASISVQQLRLLLTAEQSQLENEKFRQALDKERELNELKSRVIRTIAHEYRTPLTIISLAAESLKKQYSRLNNEQRLNFLEKIRNATQHLANLVDDVLLMNQVEGGEMEFNPCKLDLAVFCRQLVNDFQILVNQGQSILFIHQGSEVDAYLDKKLLRHILTNLLSNAIKYSPEGSTVLFQLTCRQNQAIFRVQDHGVGIPPEDRPRLFESFHRASNVATLPGTGLGLAIAKNCVDLHRGEISFETAVGVGTTFIVKLPFTR